MPEISRFYGIVILMFFNDHAPPHFHAWYGQSRAAIEIKTLGIISGSLPKKAYALVVEWAMEHREELAKNWERCEQHQKPEKIEPL